MSYCGFNTNGGLQPCLAFFQRFSECAKRELLPTKMCSLQAADYLECIQKNKEISLNFRIQEELHKGNILELPVYDPVNDRFVSRFAQEDANTAFAQ